MAPHSGKMEPIRANGGGIQANELIFYKYDLLFRIFHLKTSLLPHSLPLSLKPKLPNISYSTNPTPQTTDSNPLLTTQTTLLPHHTVIHIPLVQNHGTPEKFEATIQEVQGEGSSSGAAKEEEEQAAPPPPERPPRLRGHELWFDEEYKTVVFASLEQFECFQRLKVRQINFNRYLDSSILQHMGIYDDFVVLLWACGLRNWITMWHPTHKLLTYEFLNSKPLSA